MKIGIVGAGILGRLLALSLCSNGHSVSIFDRESGANCSMVAAGLLAPVAELEKSDQLIFSLGLDSLNHYWPEIINKLDVNIYFKNLGSIVVSHPHDYAEMQQFISKVDLHYPKAQSAYIKLQRDELVKLEPELGKFNSAYYLPDEGQLDNQAIMHALKANLLKNGVEWHTNKLVTQIKISTIITGNDNHTFDLVLDCRGVGAKDIFTDLLSVRGELIWLHAPDVNITRPVRLMHPRYHLYIVPRPEHQYIIGASEIYTEDYSPISVRTTLELLTAAYSIHPGFVEARIIKSHTQCRPAFSNHLPRIKSQNGYVSINGLYRHGFLIAPALANEITRWIDSGISSLQYPQVWSFA